MRNRNNRFPDQQETEAYLKTLPPRTVRKFWKFVESEPLRSIGLSPLSPFDDLKSNSPGILTARIFNASQKWRIFTLSPNTFLGRARNLAGDGIIDIFEKLPSGTQQKMWTKRYLRDIPSHCTERAYLELLHRTGLPLDFYMSYESHDAKQKRAKVKAELSQPSEEFLKFFNHTFSYGLSLASLPSSTKNSPEFDSSSTESLMMLRRLYGEENVIEMYDRFIRVGIPICSNEAITVLDSWEEWKHYSADWIAASNGFKHQLS